MSCQSIIKRGLIQFDNFDPYNKQACTSLEVFHMIHLNITRHILLGLEAQDSEMEDLHKVKDDHKFNQRQYFGGEDEEASAVERWNYGDKY